MYMLQEGSPTKSTSSVFNIADLYAMNFHERYHWSPLEVSGLSSLSGPFLPPAQLVSERPQLAGDAGQEVHPQNLRFQNVRFQNVRFTKRQVYKTSGFKTSGF
jgi:hypothetical protein